MLRRRRLAVSSVDQDHTKYNVVCSGIDSMPSSRWSIRHDDSQSDLDRSTDLSHSEDLIDIYMKEVVAVKLDDCIRHAAPDIMLGSGHCNTSGQSYLS